MRTTFALLVLAVLLAGCTASGTTDHFAYTRQPLYASGFDLARIAGESDTQTFRVTDGSIAAIRMLVWVNATAGGGTVVIKDPAGKTVLSTSETVERSFPLNLGAWTVTVTGETRSAGMVHVLVVRG